MTPQQITAVYRCRFGPGAEVSVFDMSIEQMVAQFLKTYPLAASIEDIFARGDLTPEWRDEAYRIFL